MTDERFAFNPPSRAASVPAAVRQPSPADEDRAAHVPPSRAPKSSANADQNAFRATLLFTAILFLRPQDIIVPLEPLHLAELSAMAGLISLVLGRLARHQPLTKWTPEFVAVLAFGAIMLATSPFSIWFGGSIGVFTELYAKVILVYLLAVNVLDSTDRLEQLTWLLVLAVGFIGFRAVLDYARGVNMIGHGTRVMGSVGGIMENPNDLALNMVAFLPLAVFNAMRPIPIVKRLTAAGCALCMMGAIVASGSRGGFLGFAAMLLVLAAFAVRQRPAFVIAGALVVLCALPVLPDGYWRRIESITDPSKDDFQSSDARKRLFGESFDAFLANPLTGVGAGEFKDWNPEKRVEAWHESHNVWLQVGSELGIFGFAVFVFLVSRSFAAVFQTRRLLRRIARTGAASERRERPVRRRSSGGGRERRAGGETTADLIDAHSAAMVASLVGWFVCAFFASVAYNWTFYYLLVLAAAPRDILRAHAFAPAKQDAAAGFARAERAPLQVGA
jgi:O-antigen ligase